VQPRSSGSIVPPLRPMREAAPDASASSRVVASTHGCRRQLPSRSAVGLPDDDGPAHTQPWPVRVSSV
jgi:hypothetical protein